MGPDSQVVCANSNVTFQTTVPWTAPAAYVWKFEGAILPDANAPTLTITNVTAANVGRYCVEITGPCESVTNCATLDVTNCLPVELCSLTQGFYSDPDAQWNGFSAPALLTNLLSSAPLTLGIPGVRSVSISLEDISNLVARLPARGPASALPDSGDQLLVAQPLNKKDRFDNALFGQAITLQLNTRLDVALLSFSLTNPFCTQNGGSTRSFEIPDPVLAALADPGLGITNAAVAGLVQLANVALAGMPTGAASLSNITAAVDAISLAFDGCRTVVPCESTALLLPPNDAFENRILVTNSPAPSMVTVSGWNVGATAEPREPDHVSTPASKSVWWQWTATQSGLVGIRTTGSSFDSLLAVYTGPNLDELTPVASNDDGTTLLAAEAIFSATAGTSYLIAVDGYSGDCGNIVLTIIEGILP
jgi:hypothetical protein